MSSEQKIEDNAERLRGAEEEEEPKSTDKSVCATRYAMTETETPFGRWALLVMKFLAIVVVGLYMLDAAWFYIRQTYPSAGQASGSVHRVRLLAIQDKGNKTEFEVDAVRPEEDVPCAHSVFSHGGQQPCWYVVRHAKDPIPM